MPSSFFFFSPPIPQLPQSALLANPPPRQGSKKPGDSLSILQKPNLGSLVLMIKRIGSRNIRIIRVGGEFLVPGGGGQGMFTILGNLAYICICMYLFDFQLLFATYIPPPPRGERVCKAGFCVCVLRHPPPFLRYPVPRTLIPL